MPLQYTCTMQSYMVSKDLVFWTSHKSSTTPHMYFTVNLEIFFANSTVYCWKVNRSIFNCMHHISGKLFVLTKGHLYVSATNIRIINTMSITRSKIKRRNLLLSCFVDQILLKGQSLKKSFQSNSRKLSIHQERLFPAYSLFKSKKIGAFAGSSHRNNNLAAATFLAFKIKKNIRFYSESMLKASIHLRQ